MTIVASTTSVDSTVVGVAVKNTEREVAILPDVGGSGIVFVTFAGMLLLIDLTILLVARRKRRVYGHKKH